MVITDFGVSKGNLKMRQNLAQSFTGTVEYMAPEICANKSYTYSVDWYSLGLVVLEMISGYHPFRLDPKPADHVLT